MSRRGSRKTFRSTGGVATTRSRPRLHCAATAQLTVTQRDSPGPQPRRTVPVRARPHRADASLLTAEGPQEGTSGLLSAFTGTQGYAHRTGLWPQIPISSSATVSTSIASAPPPSRLSALGVGSLAVASIPLIHCSIPPESLARRSAAGVPRSAASRPRWTHPPTKRWHAHREARRQQ